MAWRRAQSLNYHHSFVHNTLKKTICKNKLEVWVIRELFKALKNFLEMPAKSESNVFLIKWLMGTCETMDFFQSRDPQNILIIHNRNRNLLKGRFCWQYDWITKVLYTSDSTKINQNTRLTISAVGQFAQIHQPETCKFCRSWTVRAPSWQNETMRKFDHSTKIIGSWTRCVSIPRRVCMILHC